MIELNDGEGFDIFKIGDSKKKTEENISLVFDDPLSEYESTGFNILKLRKHGIRFNFLEEKIYSIGFLEPAEILLINNKIRIGHITKREIVALNSKHMQLEMDDEIIYSDIKGLIFNFEDSKNSTKLDCIDLFSPPYVEYVARTRAVVENWLKNKLSQN